MREKRVLITGGSGYIGGYLTAHFSSAGFDVCATYCRNKPRPGGPVRWVRWAMNEKLRLPGERFDLVIHNASTLSCDPAAAADSDIRSFFNLLPVVGGAYFAYISSMDVFGRRQAGPLTEAAPASPENWYGFGKRCVESAVQLCGRLRQLRGYGIIRIPYALSRHPRHLAGFWGRLARAVNSGRAVRVKDLSSAQLATNGFSWVDPSELAAGIEAVFEREASGVFHATNGFVTWREFFRLVSGLKGETVRPVFSPESPDAFSLLADKRVLRSRRHGACAALKGKSAFTDFLRGLLRDAG